MSTQQKNTHTLTPEQERVAEMLRDIFDRLDVERGDRQSVSLHLHRIARRLGITIQKGKVDTFLAVLEHTQEIDAHALGYFTDYIVPPVWKRAKAEGAADGSTAGRKKEKASARPESHQDKTRRELLENCPRWGREYGAEVYDRLKLGATIQSRDNLARYNIRKGDRAITLLDGDVEHGELALVSYYSTDDRHRYFYAAFLVVEGDHFCIRPESHLECDDSHADPEELTIIGRIVAVERGYLPVKLKGLELRGLPYAEELPPVKDEDED